MDTIGKLKLLASLQRIWTDAKTFPGCVQGSEIIQCAFSSDFKVDELGSISTKSGNVNAPFVPKVVDGPFTNAPDLIISSSTQVVNLLSNGEINVFRQVVVQSGCVLTVPAWDGTKGGFLQIHALEVRVHKKGKIDLSGRGYLGGKGPPSARNGTGNQGESDNGPGGSSTQANGCGGGGGIGNDSYGSAGGGGGGNRTAGSDSENNRYKGNVNPGGKGGSLREKEGFRGGGGGSGFAYNTAGQGASGGNGGGVVVIEASIVEVEGVIDCSGENGHDASSLYHSGGGGGAGGVLSFMRTPSRV
eukprot:TRINITY_DN13888_c0_g1_i3.p1 TRINITY_DN13888_c0_g1~~TRINITY_DN13888_c0_g1_i3.p1  ORF type:complete len:311 (+),score=75.76 TRINITY_DN13888_c0_g1_i3:28-933(+)